MTTNIILLFIYDHKYYIAVSFYKNVLKIATL
jgi:hypothetical protein